MVRQDGTVALVLPLTALQGASWQKVRQLIARSYRDAIILTIAAARPADQSFSADTGMAETMLVCRKSADPVSEYGTGAPGQRGLFVSLQRRPRSEMEATELAKAIAALAGNPALKPLEDGPYGGLPLVIGEEQLGEGVDAPLSKDDPWSAIGIADFSARSDCLPTGRGNDFGCPQCRSRRRYSILDTAAVQQVCRVGIQPQQHRWQR